MHDHTALTQDRIGHLRERLERETHQQICPLQVTAWQAPGEPVSFREATSASYQPFPVGTWWGAPWSTWWLHVTGTLPADHRDDRVDLSVNLGFVGTWAGNQSEAMVYTATGRLLRALNPRNHRVALNHGELATRLVEQGEPLIGPDGRVEVWVEAAGNPDMTQHLGGPTNLGDRRTAGDEPLWQFQGAELGVRRDEVWGLWLDVDVLDGLMRQLPSDSTHRAQLLHGLERAVDEVDHRGIVAGARQAREILAPYLHSGASSSAQQMTAIGHAHIDSAWLWPLRETRRKVVRTFSNVVSLAEDYPDFHFVCTTAQHYAWLQESAPELFARVQSAIERGQWHPEGGMWVESDTNLPSGESLVRQFTSGLRWMREELGVRPDCLWLPDSFGYTGALPQIARLAGMRWFLTQKLSWNTINTLPHHTFWWEGIDGTRIWTHFPPVDCYDSVVNAQEIKKAEANFKEKGVARRSILPFGYGDGGGGPTAEQVERARRFASLEDAPQVRLGSPDDYFDGARADHPQAPVWHGELYLELHRGVYTSVHALKDGNRRAEAALMAAEWLTTLAARTGHLYPHEQLEQLWRRTLLLQFHDILPGSSIAWVNREAIAEYDAIRAELGRLMDDAWDALTRVGDDEPTGDAETSPGDELTCADRDDVSLANPSTSDRREVVTVDDRPTLVQVPALAVRPLADAVVTPDNPVQVHRGPDTIEMTNGLVKLCIGTGDGLVHSIVDLTVQRELLLAGQPANRLVLHPDHPDCFDAWELQHQYRHSADPVDEATEVNVTDDPLRCTVRVERHAGDSSFIQTIGLDADSRTIHFCVNVDWAERARVLKVDFPLDVAARTSRDEIQFGHIDRPIGANTSWDDAHFESCGQQWMLLGEPGYAVALANQSSHGHDVTPAGGDEHTPTGGVMARLTLLRSPQCPDPRPDRGRHHIAYSLLTDAGIASAHVEGARLNQPLQVRRGVVCLPSLARIEPVRGMAVVDAVKQAFDGSSDLVVRLHEASGGHSRVRLLLDVDGRPREVDLLEEPVREATQQLPANISGGVDLTLRPFQILTLRVSMR
ncbi:MAG: glycoside hydrolase family 38 C-terminal domain-containing protein [Cutibacterium granulosum]|uniref:alpha-mannosidase n=1 Tax=Cutibacterium granulosum TaxID=33011 RepID=UPI002B23C925|nr:glycoside hydrolase family 38 C-terminal domain-containing protein [Cutibacterium granulosum]MEA5648809.1 glycoside hydrolase family 38 C-terminal domain-containing protein [Cutibacterium granulosum]MEA5653710.1 glycoside hydrolase family 38 C-terminal domain-containing protein [Cutibacterium granulosum]MEA5663419.1 glycoside hydrolase family 38 C-terminal domain-containing protein [Cutibacterium granulosum]